MPDLDPVLVVPLVGSRRVTGVLTAARLCERPAFTDDDLDMVTGFANQSSLAVELTEARAAQQRAALYDDRERIAADLHDHVIQRLFGAGLALQSVTATLGAGTAAADRVLGVIGDLDATISQIRTTIFQLQQAPQTRGSGLRARVLDVLADATAALGFNPATRFAGALEAGVPGEVSDDLVAVLREALSNIARHASAGSANVDLAVGDGRLTLAVADDGIGMTPTPRRSGLANLQTRAQRHRGTLTLTPREPSGTLLTWSVPIP